MTLSTLTAEIKTREQALAYGGETTLWGDYCERMRELTGVLPYDTDKVEAAGDPEIADAEATWWTDAYDMLASDPTIGLDEITAKLS